MSKLRLSRDFIELQLLITLSCCGLGVQVQKELGIKLHDPAETYIDMATTLIQTGIAKPVPK